MPFTPFHLGPALAVKSLARKYFSFTLFGFSQIMIDLEPGYYLFKNQWPVHRFLHTYVGATLVLAVALLIGKPICEIALRIWNATVDLGSRFYINARISWLAAVTAAVTGVYSHVFLDSIMHSDIRPLAPFAESNSLLHAITLGHLHLFCIYTGLFGLVVLFLTNMLRGKKNGQNGVI